jgi:sulfocyanin SoxE-like protein
MPSGRALAGVATLLLAVVPLASAHGTRPSAQPGPSRFLAWNAQTKVVRLTLLAGLGNENGGFNFDGYGRGRLFVTVPLGWRVVVACENRGVLRHSCTIVSGSLSTRPAFRGATSPSPLAGLAPGRKATFSFVASHIGSFRIACLVPGHEQARMWDVLDVARGGRPSISARPGP